ncbi:sensor histidine kinase [Paraburkholderia tropica]|uniref:sensor histidine kinase n=1 Tax=Paraburkholderia tropica TaxID=92647 RepID=UPI0015907E36|nr:HAMP domain-containing sensor histidine kinase [Paraburkholderia tropica]
MQGIQPPQSAKERKADNLLSRWVHSLSLRLWVTNVVAFAACVTALAGTAIYMFDHYPEVFARRQQADLLTNIADGIVFNDSGEPVALKVSVRYESTFQLFPNDVKYRVLDDTGRILLTSLMDNDHSSWLVRTDPTTKDEFLQTTTQGKTFTVATQRREKMGRIFYVQLAESAQFVDAVVASKIQPIPVTVGYVLVIATVIFGLVLPLTIRRMLKPLREASYAAMQIEPRKLKMRLSSTGIPSEIKPLIVAFNAALSRLDHGFSVQQQFLAAAAHELQTPLTLLRGQIELQPEISQKELLLREIDLMARQVKQLLHLAEVSEEQTFCFSAVKSIDIARDVVVFLASKADARQVKLRIDASDSQSNILADPSALFILLKNLVENAIHASAAPADVIISIDEASICIEDSGSGIPDEHMPFLFERFWRAPRTNYDGAGIGLSICKEIALAHQWRLTVTSAPGTTRFTVWL